MNKKILNAIQAPADFSNSFSNFVGEISQSLSNILGVALTHDNDMNYNSAQRINLWLNEKYMPVDAKDHSGTYKLITFVSSKGKFFTFLCQHRIDVTRKDLRKLNLPHPGEYWLTFKSNDIPSQINLYMERIMEEMTSLNYTLLSGPILDEAIKGQLTDLDGTPATLFQVLFSEIY